MSTAGWMDRHLIQNDRYMYMYVCMCMFVYVCVCMYVHACMYVCLYVCMYIYNIQVLLYGDV